MTTSQALTTATPQSGALVTHEMTVEQKELIKRTIAKGATDDELKMFLHVCQTRRIDPFSKMLYLVPRWNSKTRTEEKALQSSIDYFRLVADRSDVYEGQAGPQWCGDDGVWKDVWLAKAAPAAARVGVWRKNFREPLWAVALWTNYVQTGKDGNPTKFWNEMGPLMLAKCAESLALRRAFPEDLSGLYTADEMEQAANGKHDDVTGEGRAIAIQPPAKAQQAPRTVTAEVVKPDAEPAKDTSIRLFAGCIKGHPGIAVPERIHARWDSWKSQVAWQQKSSDTKSALAGKTWEHASEGSRDGNRMRELKWAVEDKALERMQSQSPLSDMHYKAAWTLKVMLDKLDENYIPFSPPHYGHDSIHADDALNAAVDPHWDDAAP